MREDFNPVEKLLANQNGRCFNMAAMISNENDLLESVSLFYLFAFRKLSPPHAQKPPLGIPIKIATIEK